jgi:hypothetical protein
MSKIKGIIQPASLLDECFQATKKAMEEVKKDRERLKETMKPFIVKHA